jgi:hypothetical protein
VLVSPGVLVDVVSRLARQRRVGKVLEEQPDDDAGLKLGQRDAGTEVSPITEGDVAFLAARYVE